MDQLELFRLYGHTLGGVLDWSAVLLFVVIAVVYFLAPVVGYRADRRGGLSAALFLLIGYASLSMIQIVVWYTKMVEPRPPTRQELGELHLHFLFAMLKMGSFILSMLVFALGLLSLRLRRDESNPFQLPRARPEERD